MESSQMTPHIPQLQKYKKNEIVEAIQTAGLDPRGFDLTENETEARIEHKQSKAAFTIGGSPAKYVGQHVFGDWPAWPYEAYSWPTVMQSITTWLSDVKRDVETPDLWAELQGEAQLLGGAYDAHTDNGQFTEQEKAEIAGRLNELARYAGQTYSLTEAQVHDLDARLDYLVEASGRLGRKDWRNAFVGAILGFVLTAAIPSETARDLFFMLLRGISRHYGLPELPEG